MYLETWGILSMDSDDFVRGQLGVLFVGLRLCKMSRRGGSEETELIISRQPGSKGENRELDYQSPQFKGTSQ